MARPSNTAAPSGTFTRTLLGALCLAFFAAPPAAAAEGGGPSGSTIFDLKLGAAAQEQPAGFTHFACGSDGGPPGEALSGWVGYTTCPADAEGLHEVAFEYGDRGVRAARDAGNPALAWGAGTQFAYFPIIASGLFDDAGLLRGVRLVTDPRPEQRRDPYELLRPRSEHYLLQLYLMEPFGMAPSDCQDLPLADGQTPVVGMATNRVCVRSDGASGRRYRIEARYYHRAGEHDIDPDTGMRTRDQFLSETRAEIRLTDE